MWAMSAGLLLFGVTWAAPMLNEDSSSSNRSNAHRDLTVSMYPEPREDEGAEKGEVINLPDQERYGAALIRSITQPTKRPLTGTELRRDKSKEKKPVSVLSLISASFNDAKDHVKDEKSQQRHRLSQNSPVKSKHTHQVRRSTHYLTRLPQIRKIPSDFEGSGSPDLQVRGDNDVPPFSGDGQPFMHIPGKGDAVGPGLESSGSHMGLSGPGEAEIVNSHTSRRGPNEIPEREGHGSNAIATRDKASHGAGASGVSLVEGSNDITGSTNFRELPGKEGNRIDAGSQNVHQGNVEFHYPLGPSKRKLKGGGTDDTGSASYNEIPKRSKGSSGKDAGESKRSQVTSTVKQKLPGKGKSQGLVLPSHSLGNKVKSEGDSSDVPSGEGIRRTHSRTNHYVHHGQSNSSWNKGVSQWRGPWLARRRYSNRRLSTHRRHDSESSESSDSGSSSDSDGD